MAMVGVGTMVGVVDSPKKVAQSTWLIFWGWGCVEFVPINPAVK